MKYFFIGFNKNGSSTINSIFKKNNYNTQHSLGWELEKYDVFSDTGILPFHHINTLENFIIHSNFDDDIYGEITNKNILIIKMLDEMYPDSNFILNTRPIYDWVASRFKHGVTNKREWGIIDLKKVNIWLKNRDIYYKKVFSYFKNKSNFHFLNINSDTWIKNLCYTFNLNYIEEHINRGHDLDKQNLKKLNDIFDQIEIHKNIINASYLTTDLNFNRYVETNFQHLLIN